ncbi:MAG: Ig-like domain-containing protein, partial [Gemmatimonadaceae bacterium]
MSFSRPLLLLSRYSLFSVLTVATLAACGGSDSSGPPKVATVAISTLATQIEVGATTQLVATAKDAKGNALTGRTATWSSSLAAVASVDANGVVSGITPGAATITLTIEGASATQAMTVTPVPVAFIVIDNRAPAVKEGSSVQLTAATQDAIGRALSGRPVTWSSANAAVASVNASGLVSGIVPGRVYIRAESETKLDSVPLRVRSLQSPTIVGTSGSATWTPGTSVTVTGTNFAPNAADNQVFISGVNAPVTAATASSLTVTVPAATSLPCTATGPVPVIISVNGDSVSATATLSVATQRAALAVGQSVMYTSAADLACNEFAVTGGTYLVTAFNTAPLLSTRVSFQLLGATKTPPPSAAVNLRAIPSAPVVPSLGPLASQQLSPTDRFVRGHLASLEANRSLLQRKGNPHRAMMAARSRARAAA